MTSKYIWILIPVTIILVGAIAAGAFFLGKSFSTQTNSLSPSPLPLTLVSPTNIASSSGDVIPNASLFTGKVKKISQDLGLFIISENDKINNIPASIVYYEAGVYAKGDYTGYSRILAIRPSNGPGPSLQYMLATKDFKTYLLDDPEQKTTKYPEKDWDNPYIYIDKTKISKAVTLDNDHPKTITLAKPFGLMKEDVVLVESTKSDKKDANGNVIYLDAPVTVFKQADPLSSSEKQLILHRGEVDWGNGDGYSDAEKNLLNIRKQYLNASTYVQASDSTGLTVTYVMTTQKDIDQYLSGLSAYEQKIITYKKQLALYNEKKLKDYPTPPEYPAFPNMNITKQAIGLSDSYYNTYNTAFPGACGGGLSTTIVNSVKDEELEAAPSSSAFPVFILKDVNHPLNQLEYDVKTSVEDIAFKDANDGKTKPTFDQYVVKHPLLFFKDAWGRWGVMGEYDIKLMGGCGKPVMYLYPEKPTDVHIAFTSPVSFSTQIPTYHDGWYVHAQPNGALTDLQPQFTRCSVFDNEKFGSEYAKNACESQTYPYLYWSGKSVQNPYPIAQGGWIIDRQNLSDFLNQKLIEIGLTYQEKSDMISYWLPTMLKKNMPFYRISFFTTQQMNNFIPMDISPKPQSVLRVFLDYDAISTRPSTDPIPQQFNHFIRNGFTVVEWGGVKDR